MSDLLVVYQVSVLLLLACPLIAALQNMDGSVYLRQTPFESDDRHISNGMCQTGRFELPVIETDYGKLKGRRHDFSDPQLCSVIQYLGVPYALPPIEERRWEKPEQPIRWIGIKDATKMSAICPQNLKGPFPHALLPIWFQRAANYTRGFEEEMSEDCLYLNIYVPIDTNSRGNYSEMNKKKKIPVMVFIHGHTFMEGSGNFYDGSVLASYGKVIVVTINYRLGVLGFLSTTSSRIPGNYGLWDQLAALEWISKNIIKFGGDKDHVTLFGSGAGASSISLLTLSVQGGKYFEKAILQSGSALSSWSIVRRPAEEFRKLKKLTSINCDMDSDEETLACLRKKDWRELVKSDLHPQKYDLSFGPVVDGRTGVIPDDPKLLMDRGEFLSHPMIVGVTQGDGCNFILQQVRDKVIKKNSRTIRKEYSKSDFQMDVDRFVDGFYSQTGEGKAVLRPVIEFMYTDWTQENNSTSLKRSILNLYTDKQWVEPLARTAQMHVLQGNVVYFYTFQHRPDTSNSVDWIDAGHGDELPYIFGSPFTTSSNTMFGYNYSRIDRMVSSGVMTYWANFAKTGNPMDGSEQKTRFITGTPNKFEEVPWPRYDLEKQRHLEISKKPKVGDHYRADEVAFWSRFITNLLQDFAKLLGRTSTSRPPYARQPFSDGAGPVTTTKWRPKAGLSGMTHSYDGTRPKTEGGMSLQLSITLAIGFVLLFVNIIAFSVVSYHKEKDKFKIEKLEAQLEEKRRRFSDDMKRHYSGVSNGNTVNEKKEIKNDIGDAKPPFSRPSYQGKNAYQHFPSNNLSIRASSTTALPQLKPCVFRDDSLTSTSAEESFRQSRRKNLTKIHNLCHSSDEGSPGGMLVCNSKEELSLLYPPIVESDMERVKGSLSVESGGRYSLQTTESTTPEHTRSYTTSLRPMGSRPTAQRALSLRMVHGEVEETNRPTSLWSVVSSVAGRSTYKPLPPTEGVQKPDLEVNGAAPVSVSLPKYPANHDFQIANERSRPTYKVAPTLARDISCGSKAALLPSPLEKFNPHSDTSGSETDRTGSPSRPNVSGAGSKEGKNVVTKL